MKEFVIKRNAWHMRVIEYGLSIKQMDEFRWTEQDFCSYVRTFIQAIIQITITHGIVILMLAFLGMLVVLGDCQTGPNEQLICKSFNPDDYSSLAMFGLSLAVGVFAILMLVASGFVFVVVVATISQTFSYIMRLIRQKIRKLSSIDQQDRSAPKQPSFLGTMYRTWKDKYCMKVRIQ